MNILMAIDGSKCSNVVIETLIAQYKPQDTDVVILNVVDSVRYMPASYGFGAGPAFATDYTAVVKQWRMEGEKLVADAALRLQSAGFKTTTIVEEGDARAQIVDCAQRSHADLILIGSHGWRGLDRLLLGSVSEAVARHASCSVEIVRSKHGE